MAMGGAALATPEALGAAEKPDTNEQPDPTGQVGKSVGLTFIEEE
jgi:hypothetical protein